MKNRYLISYDITNDKRRRKIVKAIEEFGIRLQYSVFNCELNQKEKSDITKKLLSIYRKKSDSIFIIPLNNELIGRSEFYGFTGISITDIQPKFF